MKTRGGLIRGAIVAGVCLALGAACDSDTTTGGGGAAGGDLDTVGGIGNSDGAGSDVGGIGGDTGGAKPDGGGTGTTDTGGTGTTDSGGTGTTDTGGTTDATGTTDGGGGGGGGGADGGGAPDVAPVEDTTEPEEDGGGFSDIMPDVGVAPPEDTGGPSSCVAGEQCPVAPIGLPDVAIEQKTGLAPTLLGGSIPTGDYELTVAEIYLDSVNGGNPLPIQIDVKSNGNTFGAARFEGEAWSVAANLDLFLSISAFGQSFTFEQGIGGGGCVSFAGNTMDSDLLECYDGGAPDVPLPTSFEYETSGVTLRVKVTVANAAILEAVPSEYQVLAKAFIKDDLDIILELSSL